MVAYPGGVDPDPDPTFQKEPDPTAQKKKLSNTQIRDPSMKDVELIIFCNNV